MSISSIRNLMAAAIAAIVLSGCADKPAAHTEVTAAGTATISAKPLPDGTPQPARASIQPAPATSAPTVLAAPSAPDPAPVNDIDPVAREKLIELLEKQIEAQEAQVKRVKDGPTTQP